MGKDCDTEDRGETDTLDWAKLWAQIHTKGKHILCTALETKGKDNQQKKDPKLLISCSVSLSAKMGAVEGEMSGWGALLCLCDR
jgi:hypothetical protein